ncbi:MAG: NAD(P)/FAD-dependent oxidoreductase [Alphaproteobacteria bacterium]
MLNGRTSFHLHAIGADAATRPALASDLQVDICIVGAGFTGLWTAWWLARTVPGLAVAVIEAERVGFGASGRNLGWLSGKPVGDRRRLADGPAGAAGPVALRRACIDAVSEIPALMEAHGIDIEAAPGGYLQVARTPAGMERIRRTVADRASWGMGEDDLRLLDAGEVAARVRVAGAIGGLASPHAVRLQPAKLVHGIARLVEAQGTRIFEGTRALAMAPGAVATAGGTIRAPRIIRATEAYSVRLPGLARTIVPLRSSVVMTEALPDAAWRAIGWAGAEGIYGAEHASFFATRTADGRIMLAGRGIPYRFGSGLDTDGRLDAFTISQQRRRLKRLFPAIDPVLAHAWCGVFGATRDWSPAVAFDPATGLGHAGGYAGQGVAASYVAGRTMADLVAGRDTPWTQLPWTNRRSPDWEPEPWRWLGTYAAYGLYRTADAVERARRSPRTALAARLAGAITGRP